MNILRISALALLASLSSSLIWGSALPSGSLDFTAGNSPIDVTFTTSETGTDNVLQGSENSDPKTYTLFTEDYIDDSASVSDGSLYFTLTDDGGFSFGLYGAELESFVLTFTPLLPLDGTFITGFEIDSEHPNYTSDNFFTDISFDFGDQTGTVTMTYTASNVASDLEIFGAFTATAVPEPATSAMMLAAAAGVFVAWRRRRSVA